MHSVNDTLARLRPHGLGRAAAASWLRWMVSIVVMALVFPVMIARMGAASFGLWAALTAPTNMTGLFGFGVSSSVVSILGRSLGRARACPDEAAAGRHLGDAGGCARSGLLLSGVAAVVAVAVGWAVSGPMVELLHVPAAQAADAQWLFRASSLCLGGMLLGAGITAVLEAVGRIDLSAAALGIVAVSNALFLLVAVLVRPDFRSLAYVSAATAVTNVIVPLAFLQGSGSGVVLRWGTVNRTTLRGLCMLALSLGAVGALGTLIDPAVKWTVGALGGGVPVATYEVASRITLLVAGSFAALIAPLFPHYARVLTEFGTEYVSMRVSSASRLLTAVALPSLALFAAVSAAVMQLWLGSDVPAGAVASVEILAVSSAASLAVRAAWGALAAGGHGRRLLVVQVGNVCLVGVCLAAVTAGRAVPIDVAAAVAVAAGALLGALLTLVEYGRAFGAEAARSLVRSAADGLILAAVVTPVALATRLLGMPAAVQLGAAIVSWAILMGYLYRREPELRALSQRAVSRLRGSTDAA